MPQLFLHWVVTVIILVATPAGRPAASLWSHTPTYPGAWINTAISAGLICPHLQERENLTSPCRSWLPVSVLFMLGNTSLTIVVFIPQIVSVTGTLTGIRTTYCQL